MRHQNSVQSHDTGFLSLFQPLSVLGRHFRKVALAHGLSQCHGTHARQILGRKGNLFHRNRNKLSSGPLVLSTSLVLHQFKFKKSVSVGIQHDLAERHMGKSQVIVAVQGSGILVPSLKLQDLVTVLADQKVLPIFVGIPDRVAIVLADARFEIGLDTYSHLDVDVGNVVASKRPASLLDLKTPTAMQSDAGHSLVLRSEHVAIVHIFHKWNRNAGWQDHRLGQNVIDDSSNHSPNVHDINTSKLEFHVCKVCESGKV
mmetsp:Transcript_19596/g.40320  ORF Transcript_19596/g.40320 Transcript_19596/m.40320 type:complete len:258 (-) Transcript_19596:546-1319(-)